MTDPPTIERMEKGSFMVLGSTLKFIATKELQKIRWHRGLIKRKNLLKILVSYQ